MRVFQAPIEIAGQMGLLAKGLKALGHTVSSYNISRTYLGYHKNIHNVSLDKLNSIFQTRKSHFDVFHFHYGQGFAPDYAEFQYARKHGKVAVMQYWGNDVRTERVAAENNPYAKLIGEFLDENVVKKRLKLESRYCSAAIVQDFEVVPYVTNEFNRIYVLPIAVDLENIEAKYPAISTKEPLILHAPTQSFFKGTSYIEETLDQLREEGLLFQYKKIQGIPHHEAIKEYAAADIVIDQVLCGSHGLFAVEAMSYGKPVISFIREDLKPYFPHSLPIISANPATLYDVVKKLLLHRENWRELGRQGRRYVERYHALPVVAKALEWIYYNEAALGKAKSSHRRLPSVIQFVGKRMMMFPIDTRTRRIRFKQKLLKTTFSDQPCTPIPGKLIKKKTISKIKAKQNTHRLISPPAHCELSTGRRLLMNQIAKSNTKFQGQQHKKHRT